MTYEYAVLAREGEHDPAPSWGCESGKGWRFAGLAHSMRKQEALERLAWLDRLHREEIAELAAAEDIKSSNMWHMRNECLQRTEFKLVRRHVGGWQDVPTKRGGGRAG